MIQFKFKKVGDIEKDLWLNMSEFHPKVKEIKESVLRHSEKLECDCILSSDNGRIICEIKDTDYFLSVFGYDKKFTITLNKGKKVIVDIFVEFDELIDKLFDKSLREMFWLLSERLEYDYRQIKITGN